MVSLHNGCNRLVPCGTVEKPGTTNQILFDVGKPYVACLFCIKQSVSTLVVIVKLGGERFK